MAFLASSSPCSVGDKCQLLGMPSKAGSSFRMSWYPWCSMFVMYGCPRMSQFHNSALISHLQDFWWLAWLVLEMQVVGVCHIYTWACSRHLRIRVVTVWLVQTGGLPLPCPLPQKAVVTSSFWLEGVPLRVICTRSRGSESIGMQYLSHGLEVSFISGIGGGTSMCVGGLGSGSPRLAEQVPFSQS